MDPNKPPANPPFQPPPPNIPPVGQPVPPRVEPALPIGGLPPPPEPLEGHSNNMFKAILGLVVVLILVGTGVVIYYSKTSPVINEPLPQPRIVRPSPVPTNPTANWQTYTDNTFTIQYPPTLTFEKVTSATAISFVKFTDASKSAVFVAVGNNTKKLTLDTVLGNGPGLTYIKDSLMAKRPQNITVDATPAVLVEDLPLRNEGLAFEIAAIRGNKIFQFYSTKMKYTDFQLMLSTFKFTEPTISIPPGNG